jgi:hypothetical protein
MRHRVLPPTPDLKVSPPEADALALVYQAAPQLRQERDAEVAKFFGLRDGSGRFVLKLRRSLPPPRRVNLLRRGPGRALRMPRQSSGRRVRTSSRGNPDPSEPELDPPGLTLLCREAAA